MYTSYFGNLKNITNPLSICGGAPSWFKGPQYKILAPKKSFFKDYKAGIIDSAGYTAEFNRLVLAPLDPNLIYNHLVYTYGEDVTLICYEKPGDFCHRRIVAEWFENSLGVSVPEFGLTKADIWG